MDVAAVLHHILRLIWLAYLTQIHLVLDPADPASWIRIHNSELWILFRILFIEDITKFQRCQNFNDLLPYPRYRYLFDNIIFHMATTIPS
jgi:hypothetical protein